MYKKFFVFVLVFLSISIFSGFFLFTGCNIGNPEPTPEPYKTFTPRPTSTPEPTKDPEACLIKPGRGIANIEINKSYLTEIENILGKPDKTEKQKNLVKLTYNTHNIMLWITEKENLLKKIQIQNEIYRTSEDIGVGSNLDVVMYNKKGVLDDSIMTYLSYENTDYIYDQNRKVVSIVISNRPNLPTPTIPPPTKTPLYVPKDYVDAAQVAIDALEDLNSALEGGITYEIYLNRKVDTQVIVNKFLNKYSESYIPHLNYNIKEVMNNFNKAGMCWSKSITSDDDYIMRELRDSHLELAVYLLESVKKDLKKYK